MDILFLRYGFIESFLSLRPAIARIGLHISYFIILIDDLESKNSLNHILKGKNTAETTVIVNDYTYLGLLLEHLIKDITYRCDTEQ